MNRVSVIIPVYNGERFLAEAVESVLAQTYPAAEIIIVNDGSTDGTEQAAAQFGHAVRLVRQDHAGAAAARNRGFEIAQMEWVSFLDADDIWMKDKLALQMAAFEATPPPDLVFGYVRQFHDPALSAELKARIACPEEPQPGIIAGTMLVRRETFLQVGMFNVRWQVGEFIDWYSHSQEVGLTSYMLPQTVLHRRLHETNQGRHTSRGDLLRILKASLDRRRNETSTPSTE